MFYILNFIISCIIIYYIVKGSKLLFNKFKMNNKYKNIKFYKEKKL